MNLLKVKIRHIENLAWLIIIVILFGQTLFTKVSIISNLMLGYIAVMQITRINVAYRKYYAVLIGVILLLMGYSVIQGNSGGNAVRFALIIVFILSAYIWKVDTRFFLKSLLIISSVVILGLIGLEVFLFTLSDTEYSAFRHEIVRASGVGDVFYYNNIYYKLELRGTPLIVFVYMLSYVVDIFPRKYKYFFRLYYLIGTILAGNFAYQLAIIIFHFVYYMVPAFDDPRELARRLIRLSFILVIIGGVLISFIAGTMKEKNEAESNPIRYDQTEVLWQDMSQSCLTLLFGTGLGHTLPVKTKWRDYRENTYFELQTLYFFNQLGLFGFTLLIISIIVLTLRYIKCRECLVVYSVYVTYAFTNPYIWDTSHIVVIVSLLCADEQIKLKREHEGKNYLHLSII